jgi:DNA-binding response OmpR family regulator
MERKRTPILMVTSKSEEIDKVLGLEMGADDYLTKPFSIRELLARVKAIIRRSEMVSEEEEAETTREIQCQGLYINIAKRIVEVHGNRTELSPKEFDLLVLLASHPGRTYTRMQLLNKVWGYEFEGFEHTVNSHINRLRSKIEADMNKPEFILTTWGVGYKFKE